jgi:hypothetical protein
VYSAVAITIAWLVGAALAGALGPQWLDAHAGAPPLGMARSLLRSWAVAAPLAFVGKALAVAAVILPVGGSLALDAGTAVADLGGMLAAVVLWRSAILTSW